jgi:hypothetical protein
MAESVSRRGPRFVFLSNALRDGLGEDRYGWRLVAANNRPLGRGIRVDGSLAECRAAAYRIHHEVAAAASTASIEVTGGQWQWSLALDLEAVGMRPYFRRVECVRGLAQFVAAAVAADPAAGVVRFFGPNSLRGYESEPAPVVAASSTAVSQ